MAAPSNLLAPTDEVAASQLGLSADLIAQLGLKLLHNTLHIILTVLL